MAGGGKETPRQKMIGLMYLVLTALLAMNVSKDILKAFVTVNDNLERTNRNFDSNTQKVLKAFDESAKSNPSALPYYKKAQEATKLTKEVFEYIEKVKHHVMDETEKLEKKDTLRLKYANAKDNYDAPTFIMIGPDETNPKDGDMTAKDLRKRLNGLHDKLIGMVDAMQKDKTTQFLPDDYKALKEKIGTLKVVDPTETEDGAKQTWEIFNFYHLPLAGVVTNLSQMQSDLKNVESEIVSQFSGASGKIAIKFNQLRAAVVAPSSYIQAGQKYVADIFIAASSSDFKDENMQIMIGVDSTTAAAGTAGTAVPLVNGVGKYEVGTGGQGVQTYKGVIKFKKPTGEYSYYPFEQEYTVAAPSATVSADQMNVFYVGVMNPVSVSAAGIAPSELNVNPVGGGAKFVSKGGGKYEAFFTTPGECTVSVSAKTKDGVKPQGSKKFRVKPLPKPEPKVGGKFAPAEMKKSEMQTVGAIGAGASGFDFQANYIVLNYEVVGKSGGKVIIANGTGSNLSGDALKIFKNPDVGAKVYVDIKVKGPDGKTYSSTCAIKVTK